MGRNEQEGFARRFEKMMEYKKLQSKKYNILTKVLSTKKNIGREAIEYTMDYINVWGLRSKIDVAFLPKFAKNVCESVILKRFRKRTLRRKI